MLVTVALVAGLLGGALAQDSAPGRIAYMQLMSGCLGEAPYREYLESVAAARRECGGDGGFFPGLANVLLSPSLAAQFPGVQGPPFSQPGVVVVQRPGIFGQLPGSLSQQSRVIPQRPNLFSTQQPGVFSTQPGIFTQHPGSFGLQSPGFVTQGPTRQPGIFSDGSGIFSVVNSPSSTTPTAATDSLPLIPVPVGPSSLRGVRARRQVTAGVPDIQQTKENMQALISNFTCILTKLAVVNSNLDLNHQGLTNSVVNLPVASELKQDLLESIEFCRDLTRCMPLEKQQLPVPRKLQRIMDYVKCEKERRLEACHKHSLRQNLQNFNLNQLPLSGSRSRRVEEVVNILFDAQSAHELELI
ncbi:uncharacterized protein LOC127009939 [Eriocheir sinensis]|uniref:uncharacterized protein LOC127009939 n=1 Tax=Eriocheir sinensis TaxID=95602 RepID=UPI0021CA5F5A|nr:uncharacterized protein LOC127009939 [Eriocheir sinensis]